MRDTEAGKSLFASEERSAVFQEGGGGGGGGGGGVGGEREGKESNLSNGYAPFAFFILVLEQTFAKNGCCTGTRFCWTTLYVVYFVDCRRLWDRQARARQMSLCRLSPTFITIFQNSERCL